MSANPNNSPAQKAAWEANKKLGSRWIRVIPAPEYMDYLYSPDSRHEYDNKGRRIK